MDGPVGNRLRAGLLWICALGGIAYIALFAGRAAEPGHREESSAAPDAIVLKVNAAQELGPISPYVYGLAFPSSEHVRQLRLKLWRWGGNPNSRYNWEKGNCFNAARDWEFRNYGDNRDPS